MHSDIFEHEALAVMYEFASNLAAKHGMDGDNSMTDGEHKRWQHAAGLAAVALNGPKPEPAADILAEVSYEDGTRTAQVIRIGADFFFVTTGQGQFSSIKALPIDRTDARRRMLEMRISPEEIARKTVFSSSLV